MARLFAQVGMNIYTKMFKRAGVAGVTAPLFDNGSAWMVRHSKHHPK